MNKSTVRSKAKPDEPAWWLKPLTVMTIGAILPFTPLGTYFGFVPPPARFYAILAAMVVTYLAIVEMAKRGFYKWHGVSGKA